MSTQTEALKLALEALELAEDAMSPTKNVEYDYEVFKELTNFANNAITAIKESLAQPEQDSVSMADYMAIVEKYAFLKASQPEQEPVAWITKTGSVWKTKRDDSDIPLYTTPPYVPTERQRKPLTDDEAFKLIEQDYQMEEYAQAALQLIRRAEAAHNIKD